jgi:hypothetical protein
MAMSIDYQSYVTNFEAIPFHGLNKVIKASLAKLVSYMPRVNNDMRPLTP